MTACGNGDQKRYPAPRVAWPKALICRRTGKARSCRSSALRLSEGREFRLQMLRALWRDSRMAFKAWPDL